MGLNPKRNKTKDKPTQHKKRRKITDNAGGSPNPTPAHRTRQPRQTTDALTRSLLEDIIALSGDEQDLDLVADVASDQEDDISSSNAHRVDESLQTDLKSLAMQLGLSNAAASHADYHAEVHDRNAAARQGTSVDTRQLPTPDNIANLVFEPRPDWYGTPLPLPLLPDGATEADSHDAAANLKKHAQALLKKDADIFAKTVQESSSRNFFSKAMKSGTLSDKISALTLAIQESPVHNSRAFEALYNIASKRSRSQAIDALNAMVDLLGPGLVLPPDRRLRSFHAQPGVLGCLEEPSLRATIRHDGLPWEMTETHLVSWAFEDWLKEFYFRVVRTLEVWCNDDVEYARSKAVELVYVLLKDKPEQEANLLRLLVNKLGDKERKVSSRASYLLLQLQNIHPRMKPVVIQAIDHEILRRPGQSLRVKYSAAITLNQTILASNDPATTEALLQIYFDLFGQLLKVQNKDETDYSRQSCATTFEAPTRARRPPGDDELLDKLVASILTGVNRATPFMSDKHSIVDSQFDMLFSVAKSSNFGTSVQSLLLIQQLTASRHTSADRFYQILYESLLDPRLASGSRQVLYLNLLLRSLNDDVDIHRVKAFVKRMLQILHLHTPSFACGLLYVIGHLRTTFPDLMTLLDDPEEQAAEFSQSVDREPKASRAFGEIAQVFQVNPRLRHALYNDSKRDPRQSDAQHSCLWELIPVLTHFHPSVLDFGAALMSPGKRLHKPDLGSYSLIRFLDKFAYRGPKSNLAGRGASIMQSIPLDNDEESMQLGGNTKSRPSLSYNSFNTMLSGSSKAENGLAEDVFFHEYFRQCKELDQRNGNRNMETEPGPGTDDDIWNTLVDSVGEGSPSPSDEAAFSEELDSDFGEDIRWSDVSNDSVVDDFDAGLQKPGSVNSLEVPEPLEGSEYGTTGLSLAMKLATGKGVHNASDESRRRILRNLPTFASAEEYEELLGVDGEA